MEYEEVMKLVDSVKDKIHGSWGGMTDKRRDDLVSFLLKAKNS